MLKINRNRLPALFWALVLCAVMISGAMPAAVFAEASGEEAVYEEAAADDASGEDAEAGAEEGAADEAAADEAATADAAETASGAAAEAAQTETAAGDGIAGNSIEGWPSAKAKLSNYICVYDTTTGTVLMDKNMDVQTPPASLTKIMTVLIAIENGDLNADVAMTEAGLALAVAGSSNLYTVDGESFKLKDMLYGIILASANDMATQVAEYIGGGSVDNFVAMMNERAKELGCTGTHFVNACGMPAEGHVSTAHDMALIAEAAFRNETFRDIIGTASYTIPATAIYAPREITSGHPALSDPEGHKLKGVIGGMLGYTDAAGSCMITYAKRSGRTVICVALHAPDADSAFDDTSAAFSYAYKKWKLRSLEVADGEELAGGGKVLTPKNTKIEDCEKEETVTDNGDGRDKIETTYLWAGVPVGTSTVLKTHVAEAAASSVSSGTESAESGGMNVLESLAESAEAEPEKPLETAVTDTAVRNEAEAAPQVQLPFGITMNRTSFISIAILALLILLGIILILITIAVRKR